METVSDAMDLVAVLFQDIFDECKLLTWRISLVLTHSLIS